MQKRDKNYVTLCCKSMMNYVNEVWKRMITSKKKRYCIISKKECCQREQGTLKDKSAESFWCKKTMISKVGEEG